MYGFLGWPMTDTRARFLLVDKLLHHCVVYDCTRGMGPVPIAGHVAPPRCPGDFCGYGARSARGCFPAGSASWVAPVSAFPGGACLFGLEGLVLPIQPESILQEFFVGHFGLRLQVGTFDHMGRGAEPGHADIMSPRLVPVKSLFSDGPLFVAAR